MGILGVFGRFLFSPFLLPKSNVFHNLKNIGGGVGVRPLMEDFYDWAIVFEQTPCEQHK